MKKLMFKLIKEIIGIITIFPIMFLYIGWHENKKVIKFINAWSVFLSGDTLYDKNGCPR